MTKENVSERLLIYGGIETLTGSAMTIQSFLSVLLSGRLTQTAAFGTLDILTLKPGEDPKRVLDEVVFTGRFGWECVGFYFSNGMFILGATRTVVVNDAPAFQAQFVLVDQQNETLLKSLPRKSTK